ELPPSPPSPWPMPSSASVRANLAPKSSNFCATPASIRICRKLASGRSGKKASAAASPSLKTGGLFAPACRLQHVNHRQRATLPAAHIHFGQMAVPVLLHHFDRPELQQLGRDLLLLHL